MMPLSFDKMLNSLSEVNRGKQPFLRYFNKFTQKRSLQSTNIRMSNRKDFAFNKNHFKTPIAFKSGYAATHISILQNLGK